MAPYFAGMSEVSTSRVVWVMRKPRSLGNFSIETSYRTMHQAWPDNETPPQVHVASRFTSGLFNRWHIWKEVRQLSPLVIHITGDVHFAAIGMNHKPLVLTIHDLGMLNEGNAIKRWLKNVFWLNLPLQSCHRIIAVSEETKRDIVSRTSFPANRIQVIPSVISPTFQPRDSEPKNDIPRVLHIGLADNKNLRGHAEALAGLNVHLRIIGEPSTEQHSMLQGHGLDYSCASKLSESQLQAEYAESDVLLFCSTLEGYGMPIIEAQTIGVPVITSQKAPMNETAGTGALLVDPGQPSDIRKGVEQVLNDATLRSQLITAGRENAQTCNARASAQRHAELYTGLIEEWKNL